MRTAATARLIAMTVAVSAAAGPPLLHTTFYAPAEPSKIVEVVVDRPGIAPSAAQLIEDGVPGNRAESAREFRSTGHGVSAVLAIDASGSLKGSQFDAVKAALRDFVSSSRAQDRVALLSFADTVDVRQAFTSDKAQLTSAITALQAGGKSTVLNQAVQGGLRLLAAEKTNSRRRLLVITDGKNEGPGPAAATLEADARRLGIAVDCIGVTRLAPRFLIPMQAMVAASGGAYVRARGYEDLRNAMRTGIEGLLGTPVLTFRLANAKADGANHALRVKIEGSATDSAQVFLPRAAAPAELLIPAAMALFLFGSGVALIVYGRRKRDPVAPSPFVPEPLAAPVPQAPDPTVRQRTQTVFAPPAAQKNRVPSPPAPAAPRLPKTPVPATAPENFRPAPQPVRDATQFRQIFAAPATGWPTAWLRATNTTHVAAQMRFPLDAAEVWIGSGEGNQIRIAEDAAMSRNHACVQWTAGDLYLFDNRSTNGTRVNERRMEAGSRVRLQLGDRIAAGHTGFSLEA